MKVDYISHMGSDLEVVNAARVSFDKESKWAETFAGEPVVGELTEADTRLIHYLAKHNHWSPFSHCYLKFRIKAPIFVARQLQKHTVGLAWNEVSRRYVDDEPEFYYPTEWRGRPTNGAKQGSEGIVQTSDDLEEYIWYVVRQQQNLYEELLKEGIAPEQARMVLPQNMMTTWIWSGSLYAFSRVCNLRLDSHSQRETSEVAQMISDITQKHFPISWKYLVKS